MTLVLSAYWDTPKVPDHNLIEQLRGIASNPTVRPSGFDLSVSRDEVGEGYKVALLQNPQHVQGQCGYTIYRDSINDLRGALESHDEGVRSRAVKEYQESPEVQVILDKINNLRNLFVEVFTSLGWAVISIDAYEDLKSAIIAGPQLGLSDMPWRVPDPSKFVMKIRGLMRLSPEDELIVKYSRNHTTQNLHRGIPDDWAKGKLISGEHLVPHYLLPILYDQQGKKGYGAISFARRIDGIDLHQKFMPPQDSILELGVDSRLEKVYDCMKQVATGLMRLHTQGYAHTDLKLRDIMVLDGEKGDRYHIGDLSNAILLVDGFRVSTMGVAPGLISSRYSEQFCEKAELDDSRLKNLADQLFANPEQVKKDVEEFETWEEALTVGKFKAECMDYHAFTYAFLALIYGNYIKADEAIAYNEPEDLEVLPVEIRRLLTGLLDPDPNKWATWAEIISLLENLDLS